MRPARASAGAVGGESVRTDATRSRHQVPRVVATSYGRRDYLLRRSLLLADLSALIGALLFADLVVGSRAEPLEFFAWSLLALPLWVVLFKAYGLYDRDVKRINHTALDDLPPLFHAIVVGSLGMWLYFEAISQPDLTLAEVTGFAFSAAALVLIQRTIVRRVVKQGFGRERVLFVGTDGTTDVLVRKIRQHREYGLDPLGAIEPSDRGEPGCTLQRLGDLTGFEEVVRGHGIERIFVTHTNLREDELLGMLRQAKALSLKISVVPRMFDVMGPSTEIDDVEGVTVLGINPPVLGRSSRFLKRSMDVAGAGLLLLVALPLLTITAIAIKLDSRGPALFRQQRIGRGGASFQLLKFRTMVPDAEAQTEQLMSQSRDKDWLLLDLDPRITRIGRFLRFTSLDELPQLWNVLRGEMSLVGPRPLIESEDRRVDSWARSRLDLMPGITGLWQVLGRTNIPFEEMVKLDYLYVTNWSLWSDLRLMFSTLPAVFSRRGVN